MSGNKKVIIWLEDRIDYNQAIRETISRADFELIVCTTLKEFESCVDQFAPKSQQVAAFILDILIKDADNLRDLGLPEITTNGGNDTGMLVLRDYIRNVANIEEIGSNWRQHKVLMLSCLGDEFIGSRYRDCRKWEKDQGDNIGNTRWLSKGDEYGDTETTLKEIKNWLDSL